VIVFVIQFTIQRKIAKYTRPQAGYSLMAS